MPHVRVWSAALCVVVLTTACGPTAAPPDGLPAQMLWAWDKSEDLRFLEGRDVGVAFLSATLTLEGERVEVRRRSAPLFLSPSTPVVPVVRIEAAHAALTDAQRARVVEEIVSALLPTAPAVQLDFDARASQRDFYRAVVRDLRPRLTPGSRLSVTALASWCAGDPWVGSLGADEVVPMLFRLGPDTPWVKRKLAAQREFRRPECRAAVGVSTDEPLPWLPPHTRTWTFHPRAWTPDALKELR